MNGGLIIYSALMGTSALSALSPSNDPSAVLAHCSAVQSCLPISVTSIPADAESAGGLVETPKIFVAYTGHGNRWYQTNGRTKRLSTAPRMIEIYEKRLQFDHCRWEGEPGSCVGIEFSDADVQALTHGELGSLKLHTEHEVFDEKISRLSIEIANEALQGLPSGRLYVQGLCVALVGVLANRGCRGQESNPTVLNGQFGAMQHRRLIELIHADPAADLSLERLADAVGLSVYHFVRVFKSTFGTTPHRYVQDQRVEAAAVALQRSKQSSIAEIALAHGFASQTHLTSLMRRRFGVTPGAMRRQVMPSHR